MADQRFPRSAHSILRRRIAALAILLGAGAAAAACADVSTDPKLVASIAMDPLPFPSIVAHDSLRDSLGIARPITAQVYNIQGNPLQGIALRYGTPDSGARVDTLRGYVVADTARATAVRLFASAGTLQAAPDTIYIVPAPDTVAQLNPTDSLLYSLTDTTPALSNPLQFQLLHHIGVTTPVPVRSYLVSYAIAYPVDTMLAQLMSRDGSRRSGLDTTASDGTSARRVRVRPLSLRNANDSVVVIATVRYHGVRVPGTPLRFVLRVKPHP
ncbi:MAG: hypothetical protein M3Z30_01355 [Gemmatimonadota bacterium]|nr:hypothetical protein [Gemmatimonadota bacterium]